MPEDEAIDRITKQIRNDILFNDIYPIQDEIGYLRKLIIEHRVWIISRRLHAWADRILANPTPDPAIGSARLVKDRVDRALLFFQGAIGQTTDPYQVYELWLENLRDTLAEWDLSKLLRADDGLPPRPTSPP